jgi:glyoxylase-like metal-dependent hydrolase (beta-lactamase superfamily II)
MDKMTTKIHVLHCGYIRIANELLDNAGRFSTDIAKAMMTPDRNRITLPVSAYLIEHRTGIYLVDTGWSRDISPDGVYDYKAACKVLPRHLALLYHPCVPHGKTVREQLDARGIRPEDIKAVLITHFDADHVAGLRSVSEAQRIIVPEDEAYWSVRTKYRMRQVRELWETVGYERAFYRGHLLGPMNKAIDITGDGSIMMVNLPGHTDGQAGVMISEEGKYVLIAADSAISSHNWETMRPAGLGADAALQKKTLKWLKKATSDPDCIAVLCSHDPDVSPQTL